MAEDPKAELYRFVRDRHDKFLQARQGQKARIGHLLVLTGFVVTLLVIFGVPNLITAVREAKTCPPLTFASFAVVAFCVSFLFLYLAIREHLRFLGKVGFSVPRVDPEKIMQALDAKQIREGHVYKNLTKMYLKSIEENQFESAHNGRHIRRVVWYVSAASISGVVFLALFILARILT